jgi:metal-responsive CopG/Arc/MetJ family transcriptional regulator
MTEAIADIGKKRGRPAVGSTGVLVKLPPDQLATLDAWIAAQAQPPSRPEAIRTLLQHALPDAYSTVIRGEFG